MNAGLLEQLRKVMPSAEYMKLSEKWQRYVYEAERDKTLAAKEIERLQSDFTALQKALVGDSGLSAISEAVRLRGLHPLTSANETGEKS